MTQAAINSLKTLNKQSEQVSKTDLFLVEPHLLEEEAGFNVRGEFCDDYFNKPDVVEHIRRIADAYKRGDYVPPIIVQVREGRIIVRDGMHRRRALMLAITEGAEIKKVQVLEHKGDEAQQAILIATSNSGRPLTVLERAVIYGRLQGWGWAPAEIANKVGKTSVHVSQLLGLLDLPLAIKKMIQDETVSATYAAELYAKHGAAAIEMLQQVKDKATNGKKITAKAMNNTPRMSKKMVEQMRNHISSIRLDSAKLTDNGLYSVVMTKDELDKLRELQTSLLPAQEESATEGESNDNQLDLVDACSVVWPAEVKEVLEGIDTSSLNSDAADYIASRIHEMRLEGHSTDSIRETIREIISSQF